MKRHIQNLIIVLIAEFIAALLFSAVFVPDKPAVNCEKLSDGHDTWYECPSN